MLGPGVWWKEINDGFEFFDGEDAPKEHVRGPMMQHFREVSLDEVYKKGVTWNTILKDNVELPTPYVKSAEGQLTGYKRYREVTDTQLKSIDLPTELDDQPMSTDNQTEEEPESETDIVHQINQEQDDSRPTENENPFQLQTKLAIALSEVMGVTKQVQELDKVRRRIKTHKALLQEHSQHTALLRHFKQHLKQIQNSHKQTLKSFESSYYKIHKKLPSPTESSEYKELLHSSKVVLRLLTYPDFNNY